MRRRYKINKIINKENDMLKELRIEKSKGEDFDLILKKETESMPEGLGDYIRVNRKAKGYSLKDLEKVTDISASYINRLENGNRTNLTISMAHRLARGLEVPEKELLVRSKMEFKEDEMKRYEIMSEKSNIKSFGDLIKKLRDERNLSLQDVANAVGISASYICRLEKNERRNPSLYIVDKLASFFEIPSNVVEGICAN